MPVGSGMAMDPLGTALTAGIGGLIGHKMGKKDVKKLKEQATTMETNFQNQQQIKDKEIQDLKMMMARGGGDSRFGAPGMQPAMQPGMQPGMMPGQPAVKQDNFTESAFKMVLLFAATTIGLMFVWKKIRR
eukprot:844070_1